MADNLEFESIKGGDSIEDKKQVKINLAGLHDYIDANGQRHANRGKTKKV